MKANSPPLTALLVALMLQTTSVAWAQEPVLEQVVVTATRYEEQTEKIPASVSVITAEDIEATTARTVPDVLKDVVGIEVKDWLGNGRTATVGAHGWGGETAGSNTLVLVDGRRVNEIDLSGVDWTQIPLNRVEHIEVLRGGSGAVLYGDNAAGGVINIITKRGEPGVHFDLGTQYGSYQAHRAEGGLRMGKDWARFALYGSYADTDGYRTNNYFRNRSAGFKVTLDPSRWLQLDFHGGIKADRYGLPGSLTESDLDSGKFSRRDTKFPRDYADTDEGYIQLTPKLDLQQWGTFQVGVNFKNRKAFSNWAGYGFTDDKDIDTLSVTPQYTRQDQFANRSNVLTFGFDYYDYQMEQDSESLFSIDDNKFDKESSAYYFEDTLELWPDLLYTTVGYRHERIEYGFDNKNVDLTFGSTAVVKEDVNHEEDAVRAGLTLNYKPGSKLFFSFAKSFRSPAVDEFYSVFSGLDTTLVPQHSKHYDLGMEHWVAPWLKIGATLFRVDTDDEIFYHPTLRFDPLWGFTGQNINMERTRRQGLELTFNAPVREWLTLFGSYTCVDAEVRSGTFPGGNDIPSGNDIPGVARRYASGGAKFSYTEHWKLDLRLRWVDGYFAISDWNNEGEKVDSWISVDAKLTFQWKGVQAFAGLNNLFAREYSEYVLYSNATKELAFYPSPELNALAGLKISY
ncbi:MAG: TonB-dependent receptor [Syntrophobacteria bacterium]